MSKTVKNPQLPDPDVEARPGRRTFAGPYKAKILDECDASTEPGQIGAILRREGLFSSHLVDWRRRRAAGGARGLVPQKVGRPPKDPIIRERDEQIERLSRECARLQEKLRRAEIIVDAQKKLAEVLNSLRVATGNGE